MHYSGLVALLDVELAESFGTYGDLLLLNEELLADFLRRQLVIQV